MTVKTTKELLEHLGHDIEVAYYGKKDDPHSVTIECATCYTVLFEAEPEPES